MKKFNKEKRRRLTKQVMIDILLPEVVGLIADDTIDIALYGFNGLDGMSCKDLRQCMSDYNCWPEEGR